MQKTFDSKGDTIYEGNAWAYWITNTKFYFTSEDVRQKMDSPIERTMQALLDEMFPYEPEISQAEGSRFEYIGTVPLSVLGSSPPVILTDQWLYESGFQYSDIHNRWYNIVLNDRT